jgi:heme oxygenase
LEVAVDVMGIVAIVGGALLGAALLFGIITNKRRSAAEKERTQQATKELYKTVDREDKVTDPDLEKS